MNKEAFMKELSKRIQHLTQDERMNILGYYSELIDDKIDLGASESAAIESLGTIDYIIFNLEDFRKGNDQEEFKRDAKVEIEPEVIYQSKSQTYTEPKPKVKQVRRISWVKVIILILAAPILFGILSGIIGALFGLAAGFLGVCIGVVILPIYGVYTMITSFYHMSISLYSGLLQFGLGLMMWSLGMAFFTVFRNLTKVVWTGGIKVLKAIWDFLKKAITENGGKIIYE